MGTMAMSILQCPAVVHGPQLSPGLDFPVTSFQEGESEKEKETEGCSGTPLTTVLNGLRSWADFAGVDWSDRSQAAVPFPLTIDEEDIAKVAAYSAGVSQVHCLADLVKLENPQEAYPALVCLAAMVPRAHWRQQEVLQERFSPLYLTSYATEGHAQCRVPTVRLLLRLWGTKMSPNSAAGFLRDSEVTVRDDAAVVLAEICMCDKKVMLDVGNTMLELGRVEDTAGGLNNALGSARDPQVRDAMVILLASLCYKLCGLNEYLQTEMIRPLLWYRSDTADQVNTVILYIIACISTKPQCRLTLVQAGGIDYLRDALKTMNSTRKYHDMAFEHTLETSLELVLKILQNLLDGCDVESEIRGFGVEELIKTAIQTNQFLRHRRSQLVRKRYGLPLLSRLLQ